MNFRAMSLGWLNTYWYIDHSLIFMLLWEREVRDMKDTLWFHSSIVLSCTWCRIILNWIGWSAIHSQDIHWGWLKRVISRLWEDGSKEFKAFFSSLNYICSHKAKIPLFAQLKWVKLLLFSQSLEPGRLSIQVCLLRMVGCWGCLVLPIGIN